MAMYVLHFSILPNTRHNVHVYTSGICARNTVYNVYTCTCTCTCISDVHVQVHCTCTSCVYVFVLSGVMY